MKKIFRPTLNALVDDYAAGNLARTDYSQVLNFQRLRKIYITNDTNDDLIIGQKIAVTGRRASYETLLQEYLNDGYFFSGVSIASVSESPVIGFCLDYIKPNTIGEVFVNGLCVALLDSNNASHLYAKIDGNNLVSTDNESEAEYRKVESSSNTVDGKYLAYLVALPKASETGHLVGTTQGTLSGTGIVTVRVTHGTTYTDYPNVTCPLLRDAVGEEGQNGYKPAETIQSGSTVIISKNRQTGNWQIIEAQCPRS